MKTYLLQLCIVLTGMYYGLEKVCKNSDHDSAIKVRTYLVPFLITRGHHKGGQKGIVLYNLHKSN